MRRCPAESGRESAVQTCLWCSQTGVRGKPARRGCERSKHPGARGVVEVLVCVNKDTPDHVLMLKERLKFAERQGILEKTGEAGTKAKGSRITFVSRGPSAHTHAACRAHIPSCLFVLVT